VPAQVIVLDDGGDPTAATTNARRFVTESRPTSHGSSTRRNGRGLHRANEPAFRFRAGGFRSRRSA